MRPTGSDLRSIPVASLAFVAMGCFVPRVERVHPAVHGVVLQAGIPVEGVVVTRCVDGRDELERVLTNADGVFDLPAHKTFSLLILPVPYDPVSDFGFDLDVDHVIYLGRPHAGIGPPPARYAVSCELADALPKAGDAPPGRGTAKPACKVTAVED